MRRIVSLTVSMLLLSSAVAADESALLRCRGIADAAARLACYDALVPAPAPDVQRRRFGLQAPPADDVQAIASHIPGTFQGWEPKTRIRLANGQVWEISDGSRGAFQLVDPKVRIRRGVLGSFFLEIDGHNASPRVRRIE